MLYGTYLPNGCLPKQHEFDAAAGLGSCSAARSRICHDICFYDVHWMATSSLNIGKLRQAEAARPSPESHCWADLCEDGGRGSRKELGRKPSKDVVVRELEFGGVSSGAV